MKKLLYRSYNQKVLTGLLGGIGEFLNLSPKFVRIVFIGALFLSGSFFMLPFVYILLSLLIPTEMSYKSETIQYYGNDGKMYYQVENDSTSNYEKNIQTQKSIGYILVFVGLMFLSDVFVKLSMNYIFPIILIIIGISVITLKNKR